MPKVKIKEFKGMVTNSDENDTRLEFFRSSMNMSHKGTYVEVDPKRLMSMPGLPTPNADFPGYGFTWETGIYCTISGDKFKASSVIPSSIDKYNILALVAKAYKDGKYHRLVYIKGIDPNSTWFELSKYGSFGPEGTIQIVNHEPVGSSGFTFANSFFSTEKNGDAFFQVDRGILKLYLPHDAFWIGMLNRAVKLYHTGEPGWNGPTLTQLEGFYIDRLVEPFDTNKQGINNDYTCLDDRRLGWTANVQTRADLTLEQKKINYVALLENPQAQLWSVQVLTDPAVAWGGLGVGGSVQRQVGLWPMEGVFADTNEPVPQTAPSPYPDHYPGFNALFMYGMTCFWPGAGTTGFAIPGKFFDHYEIYNPSTNETIDPATLGWHKSTNLVDYVGYEIVNYKDVGAVGDKCSWPGFYDTNFAELYGDYLWHAPSYTELWNLQTSEPQLHFRYTGAGTITELGFEAAAREFFLIVTGLLDDRDEVVISAKKYNVTVSGSKWAVFVKQPKLPYVDMNFRLTRLRYYFKLKGDTDFDLVKEHDFIKAASTAEKPDWNFSIYPNARTDIYLSTNIGFLFNEDRFDEYKVITGFKSVTSKDRIGIGIPTDDNSNVYYSVVGGGNIQTDVILKQNVLTIPNSSSLVGLSPVADLFLAITDRETFIIKPEEALGQLVFALKDTLEYGVKDKRDIAQMKGAVIIHTRKGIYVTDGYKTKLISQAINDLVERNYSLSNIRYNPVLHEVYYSSTANDSFYRYKFEYDSWEARNLLLNGNVVIGDPDNFYLPQETDTPFTSTIVEHLVDFDGNNAYLQANALWIYTASATNITYALLTNEVDFGYPDLDKLLNYFDIDYVGTIRVHYFFDNIYMDYLSTSASVSRNTSWLDIPLAQRKPFKKLKLLIEAVGSSTKLYSIEFDFNPLRRRRS